MSEVRKSTLDNFNLSGWVIVDKKHPPQGYACDLKRHFQEQVEDCGCNMQLELTLKYRYYYIAELVKSKRTLQGPKHKVAAWKK